MHQRLVCGRHVQWQRWLGGISFFHICSDAATGRLQEVAMSTPIPTTVHTWSASFHMIWSLVMTLSTMHVLSAVHP